MKRRIIGFIAAMLLALVGTVLLVAYVKGAEDRALAGEQLVEVFIVENEVKQGTAGEDIEALVRTEQIPTKIQIDGAVGDLEQLEGLVAAVDLLPGEQITRDRFVERSTISAYARTERGPDGFLEVTLSLAPERVVGGSVQPGDLVAIVGSFEPFKLEGITLPENFDVSLTKEELDELEKIFLVDGVLLTGEETPNATHIIEHKVFVTHVQEEEKPVETVDEEGQIVLGTGLAPTGNILVTLALEAPSVERVVFTQEFGTTWLAAEPGNASEENTKIVTRGNVYDNDLDGDGQPG
ncbi:MAG: Flp pilus assembly protein CpaB [Acidimicrobiales bacterium]